MSIASAFGMKDEQFLEVLDVNRNKVKHICKIAERCTPAIEVTNVENAGKNVTGNIKVRGECPNDKEWG